MRNSDERNKDDESRERGAGACKPEDDEREERDSGGLDVIIERDTGNDQRLGVEEVEVAICGDDEHAAEEGEGRREDRERRHDDEDDEVVEGVVLGVLADALGHVAEFRPPHLRRVRKLRPRPRPRPHVAQLLLDAVHRGREGRDAAEGRHGGRGGGCARARVGERRRRRRGEVARRRRRLQLSE